MVLNPDDEGFAKAPNPPLTAGWVLFVALSLEDSILRLPDTIEGANGLCLEPELVEAPSAPKGEVVELASAAKPEEAKAAADVWAGVPVEAFAGDPLLVLLVGGESIDVLPNGAWGTLWCTISFQR